MNKYLYIANWKMTMSPSCAHAFYHNNHDELCHMTQNADIVLCPSFVSLGAIAQQNTHKTAVQLGGQNCSEYTPGPFTGEVDALSLQQIGCTYCIVGHSERRTHFSETNKQIAQKIQRLFEQNITPIACIGETYEAYKKGDTQKILIEQLKPLLAVCREIQLPIIFAYEPIWAIGTGITPKTEELNSLCTWIKEYINTEVPNIQARLVYGGSINEKTIKPFKSIIALDGFLIGNASSDFQKFKNIVL